MQSSFHTRRSLIPKRPNSGFSSFSARSNTSQNSIWTDRGQLRYRKWRHLVARARATLLDEQAVKRTDSIGTVNTESSRGTMQEVKFCVNKWKTSLVEIKEKRSKMKPLDEFRRIVRIVRTILRVAKALKSDPKRDLGEGICRSYLEMMEGYMMMKNKSFVTSQPTDTGPALFDPSLFKANKEIQISKEVRNILSLRADERTPEQLQTLLYACQTLSAFAELPIHMQESICKVVWRQSLPENKIIVKQGHLPENFYFIMSGCVTVLSENDPTKEGPYTSLATLRRGYSFGDTAIIKNCQRTATVVTKDPVQLLVIAREDYQRIFMGKSKNGEEPRHIKFCRTLDFLAGFPVDVLIDNTSNCMFHYFRRGTVIVKDSRQSDWVYIVVSGMCEVLLNLQAVTPKLTGKQIDAGVSPVEMLAYLTEERFCRSQYAYSSASKRRTGWDGTSKDRPNSCHIPNDGQLTSSTSMSQNNKRRTIKSANSESTFSTISLSSISEELNSSQSTVSTKSMYPVTADFKSKQQKQAKKQVFVRVDFLHPRSVFGMSNLDLDETGDPNKESASVSLVSRGAECVMISKKFFVAHAREPTKRWIRQNVLPYPSKDILQQNLQQKANWNAYKLEILHKVKQAMIL